MIDYFLFYKHYNIAWGLKNFSFIILPNGNIHYYNSLSDNLDILGFKKDNISSATSKNELSSAIEKSQEYLSNKILNFDIEKIKPIQLQEDKSHWMTDSGFELYALFRYNTEIERYQCFPLQIFDKYYFRAPENKNFRCIVNLIDSCKDLISHNIETKSSSFIKDDLDDEEFIGKK